ncbi:adapter molecule Crk isoform X2 [Manduca sexta]|uniref:adapter molecule Crk isoform X2 n=1 Tax=Manduca sexta TaxID=7130 RepID=UPI00118467A4|nr:adapter molecule Crk isoform X2 [Manduca sexta]
MANTGIGSFDPSDMNRWYFRDLSRAEATRLLLNETESGVFLVRDSRTITGDYVLCVRENDRVSHYIINRIVSSDGSTTYRIGDKMFTDMTSLLAFYRLHFLDTTPLIRPLPQSLAKVVAPPQQPHQVLELVLAKFDFAGNDADDLPFRRGERLMVINRDEEQWWTARNSQGRTGSIPVPYVQRILDPSGMPYPPSEALSHLGDPPSPPTNKHPQQRTNMQRTLPALARVRQTRIPNAYDKTALKLEEGDIIKVTKININGQWEGELNGRIGHFPFTYVEFLDENTTS